MKLANDIACISVRAPKRSSQQHDFERLVTIERIARVFDQTGGSHAL